jgi:tetratricopeptide (TPR) repeat protein
MRFGVFFCVVALAGCAPLGASHQADAAFRNALTSQLAGDDNSAEECYREVLALGYARSPVWNNLAVIAVHRHQYIAARHLLARAVSLDAGDLVALTNYGVMSFYLGDYQEAKRSLADALSLRQRLLDGIASPGRVDWDEDRYARSTAPLHQVAASYLERAGRQLAQAASPPRAQLDDTPTLWVHSDFGSSRARLLKSAMAAR